MAISLPPPYSPSSTASPSGLPAYQRGRGGDGNNSDGDRDRAPPVPPRESKDSKKRIHNCWMCHKAFDRPCTLKKHLLVHTGEKPFPCESCGRRFSVASNLTRHSRTCRAAHPTPAPAPGHSDGAPPTSESDTASPASAPRAPRGTSSRKRKSDSAEPSTPTRGRATTTALASGVTAPVPVQGVTSSRDPTLVPATTTTTAAAPRPRKRARRAPSPARWVPDSLRAFDLTLPTKSTPVPLPPVRPFRDAANAYLYEERDSYDENAGVHPYHTSGWRGRLPGPGLLGTNVANTSGGQLLVF